MLVPDDVAYTRDHEWARRGPDGKVRIGITDYAQDALGDVVFVQLPQQGAEFSAGDTLGEVESTKSVSEFYAPISGVVVAVEAMRARGMKIAGTTGYTRPMLDRLEALAATQGYRTDRSLAPEDAGGGRPYPWMCYRLAIDLRIYPLSSCVKIGDTESDIQEGLNAGMWTIGVTRSGNTVGLSEADWLQLDPREQTKLLACAEQELRAAGAHYTAETVAHALPLLDEIERRITDGECPK